jgi:eukaryotic translation initiation factor 2C
MIRLDLTFRAFAVNVLVQHGPSMIYPNRAASFFLPPEKKEAATIAKGLVSVFAKSRETSTDPCLSSSALLPSSRLNGAQEMWRGYYTSLRPGPNKIFVNVDIAVGHLLRRAHSLALR